ncbi:MAG TPA: tetratricopeptide repeat protein [Thiotrichales bacterium]|nr:tetratricopeptide repeat protein [Thiotrichales bacterium]
MKQVLMLFIAVLAFSVVAQAQDNRREQAVVVQKESSSVFKGLLYRVWGRLRALNPQLKTNKTRHRSTVTMGIRGAETTTTLIEPYWKDDKSDDPAYVQELNAYTRAQQFAEDGELEKAVKALSAFLEKYDDSELKPNARFALGISQGGLGDAAGSIETLQLFIEENPKHPLAPDARQVIAELK